MSTNNLAKFAETGLHAGWQTDFTARSPSLDERFAAGKALRDKVPHDAHAHFKPAAGRADPVAVLKEQAKTRLPFLVPIRHARMLASPFAFLRGSAAVMAGDLATTPVTGPGGPGVRRHARCQLRRVRVGRAQSRVRDQRFRRDAARTLGVGRQAAGGERRRGGTLPRRRCHGSARTARGRGQELPQAHARVRARCAPRRLVRAHRRERCPRRRLARGRAREPSARCAKARQRNHLQVLGKMAGAGRRPAPHRRGQAAHRPRDAHGRRPPDRPKAVDHTMHDLPRFAAGGPQGAVRALSDRRRGAQGGGRRQRRHALLGRPARGQRRRRSAVPAGQGSAALGARALRRRRRPGSAKASASSSGSA